MDKRPNIILLMADQMRGDCLGIAGHPDVKTPFLDALAAEGVRYENAYSACPTCVPARATLYTGMSQEHTGRVGYEDLVPGSDTRGWAIIDCMFNICLLYWASEESADPRFRQIAMMHADTVMENFIRPDGSVCHIVEFDPETGVMVKSHGGQGYAEGSSWTRGQGWALYGFANSYTHTGKQEYLDTAKKVAHYCIANIPENGIIPVDFRQPTQPAWEDSCGACIIAGGLLEVAKHVPELEKEMYIRAAVKILKAIAETRADFTKDCDAIVQNCTGAYHDSRHHFTMVYADYYFIEALYKLTGTGILLW